MKVLTSVKIYEDDKKLIKRDFGGLTNFIETILQEIYGARDNKTKKRRKLKITKRK